MRWFVIQYAWLLLAAIAVGVTVGRLVWGARLTAARRDVAGLERRVAGLEGESRNARAAHTTAQQDVLATNRALNAANLEREELWHRVRVAESAVVAARIDAERREAARRAADAAAEAAAADALLAEAAAADALLAEELAPAERGAQEPADATGDPDEAGTR